MNVNFNCSGVISKEELDSFITEYKTIFEEEKKIYRHTGYLYGIPTSWSMKPSIENFARQYNLNCNITESISGWLFKRSKFDYLVEGRWEDIKNFENGLLKWINRTIR